MDRVELEIPPKTFYVGMARLAVSTVARAWGIDEERVDDLKIAVSEACANAVLANEEAGSAESVAVAVSVSEDSLEVEIADRGPTRDQPEDALETWSRLTMSYALMASLVDDSTLESRDGGGTRCTLVLKRPQK